MEDKITSFGTYKRGPKNYNYLRYLLKLPSVRTLQSLLSKIPISTGVNPKVLDHLSKLAASLSSKDKMVHLMFDEISLKKRLIYNDSTRDVKGFEDFGKFGRTDQLADKALVSMIQGLHRRFKPPVAVYFSKAVLFLAESNSACWRL